MALTYHEHQFHRQMSDALHCLRTVLEKTKHPQLAEDVPHHYADKYAAAEFLTNTALAAVMTALLPVGMGAEQWQQLLGWNKARTVTLRFTAHPTPCSG